MLVVVDASVMQFLELNTAVLNPRWESRQFKATALPACDVPEAFIATNFEPSNWENYVP